MKYNKAVFYLKHIGKMCFFNKFRFLLSVVGLIVGLFILTIGNILVDTYYNEIRKSADQIDENTVSLVYDSQEQVNKDEIFEDSSIPTTEVIFSDQQTLLYSKAYENGTMVSLKADVLGVSGINDVIPVIHDGEYIFSECNIIKGRVINNHDIATSKKVVMIDEFTECILFPDGNSLGRDIILDVQTAGVAAMNTQDKTETDTFKVYTVIGVVENSYHSLEQQMRYYEYLSQPRDSVILNVSIYVTGESVKSDYEVLDKRIIGWTTKDSNTRAKIKSSISMYKNHSLKDFSYYQIIDKEWVDSNIIAEYKPMKAFLFAIIILLLLISGINAMSTMFFSVKERINEIGIKKAMGATRIDIMNQFIIEGIIVSVIAAIVSAILSIIAALTIEDYINNSLFILFDLTISPKYVVFPICVSVIYGFIFSIIPSFYGAMIKVTDSLRFE